jgi:hypothetical protein
MYSWVKTSLRKISPEDSPGGFPAGCGFLTQRFPTHVSHFRQHKRTWSKWNVSTNLCKIPQYQISWKSVRPFSSYICGRTDRDRHDEVNIYIFFMCVCVCVKYHCQHTFFITNIILHYMFGLIRPSSGAFLNNEWLCTSVECMVSIT